jgi:hypothetical protein
VTAQDVASSLYYLHFNLEDDLRISDEVRTSMSSDRASNPTSTTSVHKPLSRKPLPESARASLDIPRVDPASRGVDLRSEPFSNMPASKPPLTNARTQQSIPRRPVRPHLPISELTAVKDSVPRAEDEVSSASQNPTLLAKLSNESNRSFGPSATEHYDHRNSNDDFSITIIRRDPTSGAQWNVGDVTGRPTTDRKSDRGSRSPSKAKKSYFEISINITTPGYAPFRTPHAASKLGDGFTSIKQPDGHSSIADRSNAEQQHVAASFSHFHRQVSMEGSGFWARSAMQHQRTASDLSLKHLTRSRDESSSSTIELPGDTRNSSHIRQPSDETDEKGYTFTSLWGGRCKFTTGSGGRSLRCKHILPNNVTTSHAYDSMAAPPPPAPVSELRFNLPSSDLFASWVSHAKEQGTKRFHAPKFSHIRNKLSSEDSPALPPGPYQASHNTAYSDDSEDRPPLPPRSNYSSFAGETSGEDDDNIPNNSHSRHEEDDGRLDLSLGQEKAGGGNRGKRAKLGKLIIHDEGFKMLDLVVAANMGIWWSVWEADFR